MMIDRTVYTTAPTDLREEREMRCYRLLDSLNIKYERTDHEETKTVDSCNETEQLLNIKICKNLFLCNSQKSKFYLLVMCGDKQFKTKEISEQINSSRLSFAPEEYMVKYLDTYPGSVSILGLMNDIGNNVTLLVDREVSSMEYFGCHPCKNTSSMKIRWKDIEEIFLPYVSHKITFVDIERPM